MTDAFSWIAFALLPLFGAHLSLLHGVVTHTTLAELEELKKKHPAAAAVLEKCREDRDNTLAALDTLFISTVGFTSALAGTLVGLGLCNGSGAPDWRVWVAGLVALATGAVVVSLFTDLLPRKLGAHARIFWQPRVGASLRLVRLLGKPVRRFARTLDKFAPVPDPSVDSSDEEIRQLASRRAREGKLTEAESTLVSNAVRLDDIPVKQILTPRPVVTTLDGAWTIGEVFRIFPNLPHGRFPVYEGSGDKITGLARRRDLLKAKAENRDSVRVRDLKTVAHYVPENATVSAALHDLVRNHEQLAVVVDEFGNFSGVVTLEDIFESLLGVEIYEKDDVAVDMRELAHSRRARNVASGIRRMDASGGENFPANPEGRKS
jgi:CBS domain containing-hemolysin-like protein